ncbi:MULTISPECIES: Csu type fimbrial protein [Variovorax]|uniref:Csu type fimbrial protein n=1 Tax=Variovorax TaxID=34072 RepID=UPI0028663261|nr:spore coat protein U domain-containing protein [Variovorax sp. 3319]MDR6890684.1 spore coat protein U-like protein [Variovorax sp. 3319]
MSRLSRRLCAFILLLMVGAAAPAFAQGCSSSDFIMDFGNVSPTANNDLVAVVPINCRSNGKPTYFKACLMIPESTGDNAGINPRRMKAWNGYLPYNLYTDPARTQIIGPPPTGGGYAVHTLDLVAPASPAVTESRSFIVYGRVPPFPVSTNVGDYQAQISGIRIYYAWSNTAPPSDCFQSIPQAYATVGFRGARARVASACAIRLAQATDLNFGNVDSLERAQQANSTIVLECPGNVAWQVGLSDGVNAAGVGRRRMAGPAPNYLAYELYRDSARTLRWGSDITGGTDIVSGSGDSHGSPAVLQVYGLVPVQGHPEPGIYTDTVVITLKY